MRSHSKVSFKSRAEDLSLPEGVEKFAKDGWVKMEVVHEMKAALYKMFLYNMLNDMERKISVVCLFNKGLTVKWNTATVVLSWDSYVWSGEEGKGFEEIFQNKRPSSKIVLKIHVQLAKQSQNPESMYIFTFSIWNKRWKTFGSPLVYNSLLEANENAYSSGLQWTIYICINQLIP